MKKRNTKILIIGAGPSGMVAAGYLKKHGINCMVVEKTEFPRFSIGESLLPKSMENFEEAELLSALQAKGFQKKYGARFIKGDQIGEFDFSQKFGGGWDWTWQVPRADFDMALARENRRKGVEILFNTEVKKVEIGSNRSRTKVIQKNGTKLQITAEFIIDASGNGRVLANQLGLNGPPKISGNSSIFTHIKETGRPQGKEGELITFEVINTKTWFWYIPFSNGNTSLGLVGNNNWFSQFGDSNTTAFKAMLKKLDYYNGRFEDYPFLFEPVKLPNIAKGVNKLFGEGYVLTGNSAEFLDPIFSSGVAFGTESGLKAAKLALKQLQGENIDWQTDYADYMEYGTHVFSSYVKEWYTGNLQKLFFHDTPEQEIKEQICAVLAGYVWDRKNPFVKNHSRIIRNIAKLIEQEYARV